MFFSVDIFDADAVGFQGFDKTGLFDVDQRIADESQTAGDIGADRSRSKT